MPWPGDNTKSCCYGCPKRKLHCHSSCKEYQQELEERENKKKWLKEQAEHMLWRNAFGNKRQP